MAPGVLVTSAQLGVKVDNSSFSKTTMQTSLKMAVEEESEKPRTNVAILPFSVEALMADRKPCRDLSSPTVSPLVGTSHSPRMGSLAAIDTPSSPMSLNSHYSVGGIMKLPEEALVKSESPDREDRNPWIQTSRFSPSPTSKSAETSDGCHLWNGISKKYVAFLYFTMHAWSYRSGKFYKYT